MTNTPTTAELIRKAIQELKSKEEEIHKKYDKKIEELEVARRDELKKINSEWDEIRGSIPSIDKKKGKSSSDRQNRKRVDDTEISAGIKKILTAPTASIKTSSLLEKLDIGYPRLNKYAKSKDSLILFKGKKKDGAWSLK